MVRFQYHEFANQAQNRPGTEVGMGINVSLIDIQGLLMIFWRGLFEARNFRKGFMTG